MVNKSLKQPVGAQAKYRGMREKPGLFLFSWASDGELAWFLATLAWTPRSSSAPFVNADDLPL
jgi:hypothetical protein